MIKKKRNRFHWPVRSDHRCSEQPVIRVDAETTTQLYDGRHGNNQSSWRTEVTQSLTVVQRQRSRRPRPLRLLPPTPWSPGCLSTSSSTVTAHRVADRRQLRTKHPTWRFADKRETRHLLATSTTAERRATAADRRRRWSGNAFVRRRRRSNWRWRRSASVWKQRLTSRRFSVGVVLFTGVLQFIHDRQRGRIVLRPIQIFQIQKRNQTFSYSSTIINSIPVSSTSQALKYFNIIAIRHLLTPFEVSLHYHY